MEFGAVRQMGEPIFQKTLRVVVFQEDGLWVGQVLEHDITASATTLPKLLEEIETSVSATVAIAQDLGRKPFEGIDPAPQRFFEMYEKASTNLEVSPPVRQRVETERRIRPMLRLFEPAAA